MSGFLGFGQSGAQKQGAGMLSNVFNFALPLAQGLSKSGQQTTGAGLQTTGAGVGTLTSPLSYYQKILSGNRTAMNQAVAPQTNAIASQSDAARRQQAATGTARGGGTAGTNQQQKSQDMAKVDNALFGAQPAAADATSKIGATEAGIGTNISTTGGQQMAEAMNSLGLGLDAGRSFTDQANNVEKQNTDAWGGLFQGVSDALGFFA